MRRRSPQSILLAVFALPLFAAAPPAPAPSRLAPPALAPARGPVAPGETVEEAHGKVREKLAAERANLELLRSRRLSVLELLELMEKLSRLSAARAHAMEAQVALLRQRIRMAERIQAVADGAVSAQLARLAPRLSVMYRLLGKNPLDVLLSAQDFSALMWRARAMERLLDSDLRLLGDVQRARHFQQQSLRELLALRRTMDAQMALLTTESARADKHRQALLEMVVAIQQEAMESARTVHELETAEQNLSAMIARMESVDTSGFATLKGKLPLPADGPLEVGFGKVVNKRFNTVTVQKGVDLRAPEGAPVTAVAAGKVVYAGELRGYGNLLIVDHGSGYHSLVAHLGELSRAVGDPVQTGTLLGTVGDTGSLKGAYLYFELRKLGRAVDPAPWFMKKK